MRPFKYVNARTVNEAVRLISNSKDTAKLIAGGTDLLGTLKDRILPDYPETIVNIKTVPNLDYIKEDARGLKIGALAKLEDIAQSPLVSGKYKILAEAAEAVATPQIRRMGTIGGNLCQDVRCWYYRFPHQIGGRIECYLKGGKSCYALTRENQYNSILGGLRVADTPCKSACPGRVAIPVYLSEIRRSDLPEAARILLESNPIPSITGRVCPHFCEQSCNRGDFDEQVSIRDIERFVGDYILENAGELIRAPKTKSGKKVAIIGSGPAGLAAAYYLTMSGHQVTVFDRMEEAGGLLTYVIPAYRLPKDVVNRTVKALENAGVKFRLKVEIGKDITLNDIKKDFDSIFVATGAWNPVTIGLDGEESTGFGVKLLIDIHLGNRQAPGKKVLVIGGGNAAIDVAISALRLGAQEATMACLECQEEMPALPWEIEQAVEEGVKIMPSWGPHKVLKTNGRVTGMELIRCTSVYDSEGRFKPCYDASIKETVEADVIMMAVGYSTNLDFLPGVKIERGLITVDPVTQATNVPGIFAGGATAHGPATVIEAIAAGKRAAMAMDTYMNGSKAKTEVERKTTEPLLKFDADYLKKTVRLKTPLIPVSERKIDTEDNRGAVFNQIDTEADRCFNCGCLSVNGSDMAVVLSALNAKVKVTGAGGVRTIPVIEFYDSSRESLKEGDMVTEIQVPPVPNGAKQTFIKFRLREAIDFPIVSVASVMTLKDSICEDARIVLGAVAPRPFRATGAEQALKGKALNAETAETASKAAVQDAITLNKNAYKVEIAKHLVKKAVTS